MSDSVSALLISDLERPGSLALYTELSRLFETALVPPVWIQDADLTSNPEVDVRRFVARHLRAPLHGEIGCALAHRSAYSQIVHRQIEWCAIFEDDAQLVDSSKLKTELEHLVAVLPTDEPCIVNLNHRAAKRPPWVRTHQGIRAWRPRVLTYTTTAYLLNEKAAALLQRVQSPVGAQADWPLRRRQILFLQYAGALVEPSPALDSQVDPHSHRSRFGVGRRLQMWSMWWYLRHRRAFSGWPDYVESVLMTRLYRHVYRCD